jgi:hypothetical protein
MGIEKAGQILAPILFILNLPVALDRVPGKNCQSGKVCSTCVVSARHKWQVQRPTEVLQLSYSCRIQYR